MTARPPASTVDEYVAGFPPETQAVLKELRSIIRAGLPGAAVESISYGIPTFDLSGKHVVHFAGFTKHVGLYPTPSAMEHFAAELDGYKRGKGSVQFPLGQPLPVDLIRRIVELRLEETTR